MSLISSSVTLSPLNTIFCCCSSLALNSASTTVDTSPDAFSTAFCVLVASVFVLVFVCHDISFVVADVFPVLVAASPVSWLSVVVAVCV